jgi:hypothetical protein
VKGQPPSPARTGNHCVSLSVIVGFVTVITSG